MLHSSSSFQILSNELGCQVEDIVSMELNVCDIQPSCLGGANDEFIFSGRLDNLASSFCALRALIDACDKPEDLANEHAIRMVALFDNEEVICSIFMQKRDSEEILPLAPCILHIFNTLHFYSTN